MQVLQLLNIIGSIRREGGVRNSFYLIVGTIFGKGLYYRYLFVTLL